MAERASTPGSSELEKPTSHEGRSRCLFDHLPLAIVVSGLDAEIIDANTTAIELLGLKPRAGQMRAFHAPTRSLVALDGTPLRPEGHPAELARRENITVIDEQIGVVGLDGEVTWFSVSATPVPEIGVITTYHDITRGHAAEEELRHHIDQLDAFFDTNLDLLAILNNEWRAVRLNPAWGRMLGYEPQELDGARYLDFVHPNDTEATLGALARMRTRNEVVGFVNRMRCSDGRFRILEWRVTTRDTLIYATARDITDQRMAEVALRESEARYRAIFEQAAVGVAEVEGGTGRFLRVNQRLCDIVGHSELELLATDFRSLIHPEDLPVDVVALRAMTDGASAQYTQERRYIRKDGRSVWVNLQVRALGEPGAKSRRYVTVVEDITERHETDELLRKSLSDVLEANQRLSFQVTRMPLAYVTWNLDFRVTEWNTAAERIFGWTADEAMGQHAYDLIVPLDVRPLVAKIWKDVTEGGNFSSHSINDNCTRDGRRITCEWFNAPLIDPSGGIIGCMSMVHDITDRQRVEEKILHSQHMESLGSFAGGIAHDIGSVIRTILRVAMSIQTKPPSKESLSGAMDTIIQACGHGRSLVRGLLDFARQDLAEAKVFDLKSTMEEQIKLLGKTIPPSIHVVCEFDTDLQPIKGDENALGSAIMHLLINAIDAMPDGGILTLRARMKDQGTIEIDVEDTGLGMTKDVLDHALDPFFSTKPSGKGTGLGLPAVYGAVKAHQGEMEIHSETGRGTQVRLTLPCQPTRKVSLKETGERSAIADGICILLVDDDELVLTAVSAQLRRLGHTVVMAENGQEALDKLAQGLDVDLVLLDINMPVLDGCRALPRLRTLCPDLPVIIETGNMGDQAAELVQQYNDVTVLVRPFSLNELRAALAPWVERAQAENSIG